MIKKIFGKLPRKHSKSSKSQEFSETPTPSLSPSGSRKRDVAVSKKLVNEDISAPYSISNNGDKAGGNRFQNGSSEITVYEALPSFKDVPDSEKQILFVRKLNMCCVVFDFRDPTKNLKEKEIMRQMMLELVDYVTSANVKFTDTVMQETVKMIYANLFRELTPQPRENKVLESYDLEDDEPSMNPTWPHLQIVYEFLLTSSEIDAKSAKKHIDHFFVLKILNLFDSEDPRKREYLKCILYRVYSKFMVHRPFIRKCINNIFYRFVFETEKHNGISELLVVLGSIISGFALPLKEEHKLFLVRALIPLHKPKCLAMYHQQLSYCITQFVEKDGKLSDTVIRSLLKYWPITNSSKEILFLSELEEVLEATQQPEFQQCMVPIFKQIARCLQSLHFQVAERALFLWKNDHIQNLIRQNRKVILPIVFPALERNGRKHWNQAVHGLTLNVRKFFFDLDSELFNDCLLKFEEDETKEDEVKARREAIWKRLEEVSANKASSTEPVLVSRVGGLRLSSS